MNDEDEEDSWIDLRVCEISGLEYESGFKQSMLKGVDGVIITADKNNAKQILNMDKLYNDVYDVMKDW